MSAHVQRDPFARTVIHREPDTRPCGWCGGPYAPATARYHYNEPAPRSYRRTYTYTVEPDGLRGCPRVAGRAFCNLACMRAYQ